VRSIAFTASSWSLSACFGAIYLAAAPALDVTLILKLTMVATAVCAVAMLSMSALLWSYFGYIAIQLGAIIVLMLESPDPKLTFKMPLMVVALLVALAVIAAHANAALREKIVLSIQLRDSALRDALTGLRNRNFVGEFVSQTSARVLGEWKSIAGRRRVAGKRSLALFLVDLDHFKRINDEHGHAAGDRVLQAFAEVAQGALRAPDVVARWGGEEFLVIVETEDREAVRTIGERVRRSVAAHRAVEPGGATLSVTCSIGACLLPFDEERPDDLTWEETLELADRALYEAKRTGRNRTLWIRRGTAGVLPREALTAMREALDGAIRARLVEIEPKDGSDALASVGHIAVVSVPELRDLRA
jgi:diguanylate cyclase (GGDEF)-like protein